MYMHTYSRRIRYPAGFGYEVILNPAMGVGQDIMHRIYLIYVAYSDILCSLFAPVSNGQEN